jgi:uncharacterized protein (UPF0332 family)
MNKIYDFFQKARYSLAAAELLTSEGYHDIAASRAYYAMFYVAEALLFSKGLAFSSHSAVIAAYGKEYARTGLLNPLHHQHLRDAFQIRQASDYITETEISDTKAAEIIEWGKNFLADAEDLLKTE